MSANKLIDTKELLKGAAALMIALAWTEAAKKFIDYIIPNPQGEFIVTLLYAMCVTILLAFIIMSYNFSVTKIETFSSKLKRPDIRFLNPMIK